MEKGLKLIKKHEKSKKKMKKKRNITKNSAEILDEACYEFSLENSRANRRFDRGICAGKGEGERPRAVTIRQYKWEKPGPKV
jgi:hypothetical protein